MDLLPRSTARRSRSRCAALAVAVALLAVAGGGCAAADEELPYVSFEPPLRPPSRAVPPRDDTLRIGAAPVFSTEVTFERYAPVAAYLGDVLDRPVTFVQRATYYEINEQVRNGALACAFSCAGALALDGEGLAPLVVQVADGSPRLRATCVVPAGSPASSLAELRGATFGVTDPLSVAGRAYVRRRLADLDTDPASWFERTVQVEGHDTLARLVARGALDGACLSSSVLASVVEEVPELGDALQVIETSEPFAGPPVIVAESIDPELRASLADALERMPFDAQGRRLLDRLGVDRFEAPDDRGYEALGRYLAGGAAPGEGDR